MEIAQPTMTVECSSVIFYCSLKHLQIGSYKSLNHWVYGLFDRVIALIAEFFHFMIPVMQHLFNEYVKVLGSSLRKDFLVIYVTSPPKESEL